MFLSIWISPFSDSAALKLKYDRVELRVSQSKSALVDIVDLKEFYLAYSCYWCFSSKWIVFTYQVSSSCWLRRPTCTSVNPMHLKIHAESSQIYAWLDKKLNYYFITWQYNIIKFTMKYRILLDSKLSSKTHIPSESPSDISPLKIEYHRIH